MFSVIKTEINGNKGFKTYQCACLSTDSKPTDGMTNGSMCIEMNTGKIYCYNEAGTAWVELQ